MNFKKKKAFTLIEVVISILVISLISSFLGVKILDLISKHQFKKSCTIFLECIRRMQVISLTHDMDSSITISKCGEEYLLLPHLEKKIHACAVLDMKKLKGIDSMKINHQESKQFSLEIYSFGRIEPSALICLTGKDDVFWIDTRYGALATMKEKFPDSNKDCSFPFPLSLNHLFIDK
jgi:prepilin-type N-terminal cleavage/methylation domain-containing protein